MRPSRVPDRAGLDEGGDRGDQAVLQEVSGEAPDGAVRDPVTLRASDARRVRPGSRPYHKGLSSHKPLTSANGLTGQLRDHWHLGRRERGSGCAALRNDVARLTPHRLRRRHSGKAMRPSRAQVANRVTPA
ncbi:MAG: hypothetical protein IOD05_00360 [Rhodobacter sp.]|nr:hypothetical protein [Rhodobacter sp.]MCA3501731.1 hypothetical protein [Rhodobacter sp.]MCA3517120.1 hypothetical protein [Rhodobacter sp.]